MRLWEKSLERFMNFRWSPRTTRTAGTAGTFGLRPRPPRGERAAYASRIGRYRSGRDSAAYSADLSLEAVVEEVERPAQIFPGFDDRRVQIGRHDRRSEPLPMARELADQRLE